MSTSTTSEPQTQALAAPGIARRSGRKASHRGCGPFARLPRNVALDPRLAADELALLAYRATWVGDFDMRHHAVKRRLRVGKDRFYDMVTNLKERGYLKRKQTRAANGDFGQVEESIDFSGAPYRRKGFVLVRRSLFDMVIPETEKPIPAKAIGLYLYLDAHADTFNVTISQIQDRFGWGANTALKWARELRDAGLIGKTYRPTKKSETIDTETKNPETKTPDTHINARANCTEEQSLTSSAAKVNVVARAREDDDLDDEQQQQEGLQEIDPPSAWRDLLQDIDRANCLAPHLLTDVGLRPYLLLLREHGEVARRVVFSVLQRANLDGKEPGFIRSWSYFRGALQDELTAEAIFINGMKPGDTLGAWRNVPVGEVPF